LAKRLRAIRCIRGGDKFPIVAFIHIILWSGLLAVNQCKTEAVFANGRTVGLKKPLKRTSITTHGGNRSRQMAIFKTSNLDFDLLPGNFNCQAMIRMRLPALNGDLITYQQKTPFTRQNKLSKPWTTFRS